MKAKIPTETVDTIGKNARLMFTDSIMLRLLTKLDSPPDVPFEKICKSKIPVIKYIAKSVSLVLIVEKTTYNTIK